MFVNDTFWREEGGTEGLYKKERRELDTRGIGYRDDVSQRIGKGKKVVTNRGEKNRLARDTSLWSTASPISITLLPLSFPQSILVRSSSATVSVSFGPTPRKKKKTSACRGCEDQTDGITKKNNY